MRRGQDHKCRRPVAMRTEPICCGNAPPIARQKTWKTVLRRRSTQIVADGQLMLEKLGSDHRADGVASMVFESGLATPVAVEPRHGIGTARLQFSAYDVSIDHGISIWTPGCQKCPLPPDDTYRRTCSAIQSSPCGSSGGASIRAINIPRGFVRRRSARTGVGMGPGPSPHHGRGSHARGPRPRGIRARPRNDQALVRSRPRCAHTGTPRAPARPMPEGDRESLRAVPRQLTSQAPFHTTCMCQQRIPTMRHHSRHERYPPLGDPR